MAKLALYDSLHNKMVFNLLNADMSQYVRAYDDRNSLWNYGWGNITDDPNHGGRWYELIIGTQYSGRSAYEAWVNHNLKDYAPFDGLNPLGQDTMDGFNVKQLINKGWYTVGTTKKFYFDNTLTSYIEIYVDNETTNGWNHKIFAKASVKIYVNGTLYTMFTTAGNTIRDVGLVSGTYNGTSGYYFYYIREWTNNGNQNIDVYQNVNTSIGDGIKNRGGNLDLPITVDPDKEPLGGWDGDFTPEGDNINMPDTPDETISGALAHGFLNIYAPTAAQLRTFGGLLWTNAFNVKWYDLDSVSNLVLNAVSDPINYIVGLFMIPVTPATGSSTGIFLGGINANTVAAPRVTSQFKTIDFGTLDVTELYGNYLDYSNSRVSIYLPYIGTADIDIQEIAGGTVSLKYVVDCFTGACVANVHCQKYTETPWGKVYQNETVHSYSGNVAIQLPISAGSFDTMMQGLVNIGLGLGTNTPAVVMQGMTQGIQGFGGDVTTRGSLSSNTGKLCYQTPYLMFTRPIESLPAKNNSLHGWGAGVGGKLGRLKGYVECSDVKLDGVTATDTELTEITNLLKSGVYV